MVLLVVLIALAQGCGHKTAQASKRHAGTSAGGSTTTQGTGTSLSSTTSGVPGSGGATTTSPRIGTTGPATTLRSGVRGTVRAGPTCPVERPDRPCPPKPVSATVEARDGAGRVVGTTRSGPDGRYAMSLPAGRYTLTASTGSQFPSCRPAEATVPEGAVVTADVGCDTGIR